MNPRLSGRRHDKPPGFIRLAGDKTGVQGCGTAKPRRIGIAQHLFGMTPASSVRIQVFRARRFRWLERIDAVNLPGGQCGGMLSDRI